MLQLFTYLLMKIDEQTQYAFSLIVDKVNACSWLFYKL